MPTKARKTVVIAGEFPMHRGGTLVSPTIAYETWGKLNHTRDNAVLIFTGMSPSAHAASSVEDPTPGWWEEIIGPGGPIDTHRYFVIVVNSLGSCFGSTGPASVDPRTGDIYRLTFPVLSLEDVARGGFEVIKHLGVNRLVRDRRPVDGRHDGARVRDPVPRHLGRLRQHVLGAALAAVFDRVALAAARDHPQGSRLDGRALSARRDSRSVACGSRASSA